MKKILIVDDDVLLGNVLQRALQVHGEPYQVRLASNADEALAQISRRDFDLVITDIKMEGFSGLQLLEALRQISPDTRTIAMTAFDSPDIKERTRMLGVYGYIVKPFNIQEFRELVGVALEAQVPTTPEKLARHQLKTVNKTLADLRANVGANAVFFIEEETANVLGVASDVRNLDLTSLAKALVDITQRMTAEVARVFGGGSGFRRSQYEGETFHVTTYRLPGKGLLILVYGHHVKEGLISFYARQALEVLAQTLHAPVPAESPDEAATSSSPQAVAPEPPNVEPDSEVEPGDPSETLSLEEARARGLLNDDLIRLLGDET